MSRYTTCPYCGRRMRRSKYPDDDGEWLYYCPYCDDDDDDDDDDDVPYGCQACGGPYPLCKYSCSKYD